MCLSDMCEKRQFIPNTHCPLTKEENVNGLSQQLNLKKDKDICSRTFNVTLPVWRNFLHGSFARSSFKIAAASENNFIRCVSGPKSIAQCICFYVNDMQLPLKLSNQDFFARWCWTPFRCFFLLCMLS